MALALLLYSMKSGEMMKKLNRRFLKLLLISVALLMMACGSSKSGDGFDEASLASTTPDGNQNSTDALAVCSQDGSQVSDFEVRLQQYVDPYGQSRNDLVRLKITKAPSSWQSSNLDLAIYRWTASPSGDVSADKTPLNYQFEKRAIGGFQLITNTVYRYFNWSDIVQMGKFANISTSTAQSFFNSVTLLVDVKDTSNAYQALQVVLFDSNGVISKKVDVLIPTFQADPVKYNADTRHPQVLRQLHPLKHLAGQNWSQANYDQFAKAFCF